MSHCEVAVGIKRAGFFVRSLQSLTQAGERKVASQQC